MTERILDASAIREIFEEDIKYKNGVEEFAKRLEKQIIKKKLWNKRCGTFEKDCPNCEFWKMFDKVKREVLKEEQNFS